MDTRKLGCILFILGTSIGAGMLALPLATSPYHFATSAITCIIAWIIMTFAALTLLEVNINLPERSHVTSMAQQTLGKPGKYITSFFYIILLYALICAYLAACSDIVAVAINKLHFNNNYHIDEIMTATTFGLIMFTGIRWVDHLNKGIMLIKLLCFISLIAIISPHFQTHFLSTSTKSIPSMAHIFIMITAFGYAVIIPSLRNYYQGTTKQLVRIIWLGSSLPLILYLIWIAAIQAIIPRTGSMGLIAISQANHSMNAFINALSSYAQNASIFYIIGCFAALCTITSLLGVALSLGDFIMESCRLPHSTWGRLSCQAITFIPPIIIVIISKNIFLTALSYAGFCCVVLLILIPTLMCYSHRYIKKNTEEHTQQWQLFGGKILLLSMIIIALCLMILSF